MSRAFAGGALLLYALVLFSLLPATGLTDDDDFYLPAGESYASWILEAAQFSSRAWSRKGIDAAFDINHEHPPVAKYALGLAAKLFGGVLGPVDGPRVATVLWSTLTAALLLVLARSHLGPRRGNWAGGLAILFLLGLPRFAFHSRVGTLDVPVAAVYLLAGSFALWGERSRQAAFWAGPLFGVAAATKLNGPFLFGPMLLFWILTRRTPRKEERRSGLGLPPLPLTVLSMVVLGPLTFLVLWPWLWFDTIDRVQAYVSFHLNHYPIYLLYFGRIYDAGPFPPWHAPFVLALWTTPVATVVAGLYGTVEAGISGLRRILRRDQTFDTQRPEGDLALFLLLNAAATIAVVSFLAGPKYGGVKLFLPFFPFFCLLAGFGILRMGERLAAWERLKAIPVRGAVSGSAAVGLLAAASLQLKFGQDGLSAYAGLAGGLRGATAAGMERQYYDVLSRAQLKWLDAHAPPNTKVHFMPNHKEYARTFRWAHREGSLRRDVRASPRRIRADLLVLTHERRFSTYPSALVEARGLEVLHTHRRDGVPLWTVYRLGGSSSSAPTR
ncbi:MAG: glycosyltransferase family 39 protein [Myxococcota bacterium]